MELKEPRRLGLPVQYVLLLNPFNGIERLSSTLTVLIKVSPSRIHSMELKAGAPKQ